MVKVNEKPEEKSPKHQDFGPQSSFSNDGSFVVLEESPVEGMTVRLPNSHLPPSLTFDGLPSLGNSSLGPSSTNGQGASYMSTSMTTDLSPEEIQNKLRELLCENVELKDTLNQNNMAMRQQFHTLVKWQEEVLKVHQNHKEKFAETRDLINKLRNENEELKKCIAEMKSEDSTISIALDQQLKSENADLKTKILELNQKMSRMVPNGVPTKKEQELNGLLEQVNHQLEIAERSRRQLGGDVERLTAQRTRLERDVDTLKSKLATIQQEKTELFTKVEQLGLSEKQSFVMVENDLHLPSGSLSIVEVQHAQEVAKLKSDLDEQRTLVVSLIQQLKDRETKMVSVTNSSEAKTPSYSPEDQTLRQNFKELEEKYYRLQSDYETAQQEIASLRDDQQSKDRHNAAYNQVQARGFIEKIDSMTAQVVAKEETLKQKTKEIAQLTEKLKDLAVENEAISILKAQVEVYQSDFNAEREARARLVGEKDQLAEDLRHLQRRNQQLIDDLSKYQQTPNRQPPTSTTANVSSGWNTIGTPGRTQSQRQPSPGLQQEVEEPPRRVYDEEIPPPKTFSCPKCEMVFRQLEPLQYHVETCLELTN